MSDVLVVDDEPEIRTITSRSLSMAGHHVVVVEDAQQALELFRHASFDVVITDLHMPGQDGFWVVDDVQVIAPPTASLRDRFISKVNCASD